MSSPLYEMIEKTEIQKDIAEIDTILSGYENANSVYYYNELDKQAYNKIKEMQQKNTAIQAATAPKPGMRAIPWQEVTSSQFYNILTRIKFYLEAKLIDKAKKRQEENNHA